MRILRRDWSRQQYNRELGKALNWQGDWALSEKEHVSGAVWVAPNRTNRTEMCRKLIQPALGEDVDNSRGILYDIRSDYYHEEDCIILESKLKLLGGDTLYLDRVSCQAIASPPLAALALVLASEAAIFSHPPCQNPPVSFPQPCWLVFEDSPSFPMSAATAESHRGLRARNVHGRAACRYFRVAPHPHWRWRDTMQRSFYRSYESFCAYDEPLIGYETEYFWKRLPI